MTYAPERLIPPKSGGGLTSEDVARLVRNPVTWIVLLACVFAFFWYVRSLGGAWRYR